MTFRLPSLNRFHEYLCSSDYYKDFNEEIFIAETDPEKAPVETVDQIPTVPMNFDDTHDYLKIWEPLFFLEAKAQIKKGEKAEREKSEIFLLSSIDKTENFIIFVMVRKGGSQAVYLTNDLILLSPDEEQLTHLVGVVESVANSQLRVKVCIDTKSQDERTLAIIASTAENSEWFITKLCSIATLNREYQALNSIPELFLRDVILNPREFKGEKPNYFSIPEKLKEKLGEIYNASQYDAIRSCLKKEGITLIQGPPGTGKTTTILGVLSVLLNSQNILDKYNLSKKVSLENLQGSKFSEQQKKNLWKKAQAWSYDDNFDNWLEDRDHFNVPSEQRERPIELPPLKEDTTTKPEKILICAPSNAAIDEIIRKMVDQNLYSEDCTKFMPTIIRIGPNYHPSLKNFSLEFMVEQEKEARGGVDAEVIRNDLMKRATIVCSTLSVTGSATLTSFYQKFDTVVIDEAAQAVEISTLIPLKYECKRLILIGDPQQLPATVFSRRGQSKKYDQSLFYRFQQAGYPVHLLEEQYRMHPLISHFISEAFYSMRLKDYSKIMDLIGTPKFYDQIKFGPITFFHVKGMEQFIDSTYQNDIEASFVIECYSHIKTNVSDFDKKKFGIITPYNGQASLIREKVIEKEKTHFSEVEVNSVDGFQGREKDLIIFSTVRSKTEDKKKKSKSIGFLKDIRRMNVGLSRARVGLIVVGDAIRLMKAKDSGRWKELVTYCIEQGRCFQVPQNRENFFEELYKEPSKFVFKINPIKKHDVPKKEGDMESLIEISGSKNA